MTRIMFVCLGNICRSPMAEFLMKALVKEQHIAENFFIASAAISSEELGNPVYPPVQKLLNSRGISCCGKTAVQLKYADYDKYDMFIGMDNGNLRDMKRLFGGDPKNKVSLLLDYTDHPGSVADPWYTRDFHKAETDIEDGCKALLEHIRKAKGEGV